MKRLATAALIIALSSAAGAQAQFEVASVKKVTNNDGWLTIMFPGWISDGYQILAKAPGKASQDEMRVMLQRQLAERFQLKVHRITKTAPSYELVLARGDGKLPPQLRKSEVDCAALARLAGLLTSSAGRLVTDETGLPGGYGAADRVPRHRPRAAADA